MIVNEFNLKNLRKFKKIIKLLKKNKIKYYAYEAHDVNGNILFNNYNIMLDIGFNLNIYNNKIYIMTSDCEEIKYKELLLALGIF